MSTVFPRGSSGPKMSFAISFPRKTTRRFSSSSCGFRNRPFPVGKCLRAIAVVPARADDAAVDGLPSIRQRRAPGRVLAPDRVELRQALARVVDVFHLRPDRPAFRKALVRLGGIAGPHDREVVPHGLVVRHHLALQALAESEKDQDRHRAPGERGDGQRGALLLQPRRAEEEVEDDGKIALHSFIATLLELRSTLRTVIASSRRRDRAARRPAPGSSPRRAR